MRDATLATSAHVTAGRAFSPAATSEAMDAAVTIYLFTAGQEWRCYADSC
jgi:hypothetical protein